MTEFNRNDIIIITNSCSFYKNKIGIIRNITTVFSSPDIPLFIVEFYRNGKSIDVDTFRKNEMRIAKPEEYQKLVDEIEKHEAKEMAKKL
jgi:hypothetical protein